MDATAIETRMLPADPAAIPQAIRILAAGGLVAFPTETVYGLGANAADGEAVARLYAAKGRPSFNPLIAHVADFSAARTLALFDGSAEKLAKEFWPGPLTLVLPARGDCPVSALARAGLGTVAIRVPAHPVAQALLAGFGRAVAAPSANRSGRVSPTTAAHVAADLGGRIDVILDGGPCAVGLESTIVACLGGAPALLRPGGLSRERIEKLLGQPLAARAEDEAAPSAPGMLASHYAPRARLRLDASEVREGEALLGFGPDVVPGAEKAVAALDLSPAGDSVEAAANLFAHLHALDAAGAAVIAVAPVPPAGLGEAINDRLRRAAAPRE